MSGVEALSAKAAGLPRETVEFFNGDELRARVFVEKYALRSDDGTLVELTPMEMWRRVASEIASVEPTPELQRLWGKNFLWLLEDFRFVPGGRIMHGAGNPRKVTLLNCYVIPIKDDSLEAIFDAAKEAARTYSYGGGVGCDISILRPKGAPVNNAARTSTGAVSFMELYSLVTGTIGQAGRRGALMITIRDSHPDVFDFIDIKRDPERQRVRYANISVKVSDELMRAVQSDGEFTLWFENEVVGRIERRVRARELWNKLVYAAWESAEPGVIFWDTIVRESTTQYNGMEVITTNPCSEIPLEPYGCCDLGNINLSKFVLEPFTPQASVDWENLERAARYAVRFLDNVLDYAADKHPLPQQREASLRSRRIGVGFTGLADMLCMLRLKYDSEEAIVFVDRLFERIKNIVYDESVNLAVEKGSFPAFDPEKHMRSPFIQRLDESVLERIQKHGLRNAACLTVPPVGSGAILAGTTSGIEPIFALSYIRRSESLTRMEFKVYHPLVMEYMRRFGIDDERQLPEYFVTAHQIAPELRVRMQATIQRHIDHSISSTVNLPHNITVEEVSRIYFLAWELGCKGITVYREGSREGVLITEAYARRSGLRQKPRPEKLSGVTYRRETPLGTAFITVNELAEDDEPEPFEVFINVGKAGSDIASVSEAIGRLISLCLRMPSPMSPKERVKEIVDQLWGIGGGRHLGFGKRRVRSLPDAIAQVLAEHTGVEPERQELAHAGATDTKPLKATYGDERIGDICPICGNATLVYEEGCQKCYSCGYSEC
ncbi:MAG: adenosylcobalamin-dependent ribonucleoside-diphosphate reductase [Armatimonadota bacterium]|nr:adenosylcobalamin-dependent ribonucleoside-diphosphate reductase [Armatimonadota bacterium]MCX7778242.1 adenosylcobalamin-dependent ribonucleoside-diphosphate reductase [Armatimonadota bacterium]MDW8024947.1 adenosylcobalamin-dependent ribonucleoside-diphosphate reductase [Armatimonadota bacterium]